jgi:hypothetical protein
MATATEWPRRSRRSTPSLPTIWTGIQLGLHPECWYVESHSCLGAFERRLLTRSRWAVNTWQHVQVTNSRDDLGMLPAVTFDRVEHELWLLYTRRLLSGVLPAALLTTSKIDGLGTGTVSISYLDDVTMTRW